MKTKLFIPILGVWLLTSCSSAYMASAPYDDVYYVPGQNLPKNAVSQEVGSNADRNQNHQPAEQTEGDYGTQVPDNRDFARQQNKYLNADSQADADTSYYDENDTRPMVSDYDYETNPDEYVDNDYEYSTRIRRFHRPFVTVDYYDDFYTDYYWYTGDPWYSSWYFGPSFGISFNWGWGSIGWGSPWYNSWYNPWYNWYSPWYSPWYGYGWGGGYWGGYHDGYWDGHWNGHWNDWNDHHFYGPRGHRGSPDGAVSSAGGMQPNNGGSLSSRRTAASNGLSGSRIADNPSTPANGSLAQRRTAASLQNKPQSSTDPEAKPNNPSTTLEQRRTAASQGNNPGNSEVNPSATNNRNAASTSRENLSRTRLSGDDPRTARAQQRYANPQRNSDDGYNYSRYRRSESNNNGSQTRGNVTPQTRNYTAPSQNRTRTSDEYVNPSGRVNNNNSTTQQRRNSSGSQNRSYTPPASSSPTRTTPQRNSSSPAKSTYYSAPVRTESFSAPRSSGSSSSGSFSSPSRSSSPATSGSHSSGSGSGGGRRR